MILDEYLSSKEIQATEMNANYLGVSNLTLMESAGGAIADLVVSKVKPGTRVFVACGMGGNGGDGLVAARHLADLGYKVEAILFGNPALIRSPETKHNYEIAEQLYSSLSLDFVDDSSLLRPIEADVIVDALIGYTYQGSLSPLYSAAITAINSSKAIKVAVDTPTGLIVDIGEAPEACVQADYTVTFHKSKLGFKNKPKQLGKLSIAKLGVPQEAELFTGPGDVYLAHRRRAPDSHKGMFGRLLVVGGSDTYHGAPALASMGAHAMGLDLVYTAVPETAMHGVTSISPSMIVVKLVGDRFSSKNIGQLDPFLEKVDAVALGPGLGLEDGTKKAVNLLIRQIEKKNLPMVIDADGLKAFAEKRRRLKVPAVFTPHSREFEILTGKLPEGDWKEKGMIVEEEARRLSSVILLKGSVDIISDGQHTRYNWTGNPGMTVGGTGDVLTGITGGLLSQGSGAMQSACAAAFINGAAGDLVYVEKGYHILPEDVVTNIPYVVEDAIENRMRLTG